MENKERFTVSVYTENNIGILNRLSAIFLKRHINIESLTVSRSELDNVHRFTFVVFVPETLIQKVVGQLEKQIEVIRAYYHRDEELVYKESALFKVSTEFLYDEEIQEKLKLSRAHIVSITKEYFVLEHTGSKEEIDNMYEKLKPFKLLQFVRSGRVAVSKTKMAIFKN